MHTYIYIYKHICILFKILFHYFLFQDIEYCSLDYSIIPCCLSILYIVVCSWASLGSAGKESTCNAGDPDSIPGSGRSPGEGIGCPLQYSWASLVAQTVKNPTTMQETWVQSLGWKDALEEDMATYSSFLAWRIPIDRSAWRASVNGLT